MARAGPRRRHRPYAAATAEALDTDRRTALGDLAEAQLAAGAPQRAAATIAGPAGEHPLDEQLCALAVRALAAAGRQADALAAYQRTRVALADEFGVDPGPALTAAHLAVLRGETAPPTPADAPRTADPPRRGDLAAAQTAAPDAATAPPHTATAAPTATTGGPVAPRSNLRAALSSFVGRDRQVGELRKLLSDNRLVTLTGPGGTGKTRLATEAAGALLDTYPDGVWLVELAGVSDPVNVPHAVFAALGASTPTLTGSPPSLRDRAVQLGDLLGDRQLLLILDNCEHLVDAAAHLAEAILTHCRQVSVLATSRAPLGITGEQLYPVPPLDTPAEGVDLATTQASPAVRLLVDRAAAVRPGFTVTPGNAAAIGAICRRLDGAPLALELAAARLRSLTADQVADRLDDRFRLLTGGQRTALPRHQTLQAVVSWSWELLDEPQRALARRLSVFAGGASLDALDAVCADPPHATDPVLPAAALLDALTGLVDQSIVEAGDDNRYRMLDTLRAYGADRLAEAGETGAIRAAHLHHYRQLAETQEPILRTAEQETALARLTADYDNLLAALRYAIDARQPRSALRLGAALVWYWFLFGHADDAMRWLREVNRIAPTEPPDGLAAAYAVCYGGANLELLAEHGHQPERLRPVVDRFEQLVDAARAEGPLPPLLALGSAVPGMLSGDHDAVRRRLGDLIDHAEPWTAAAARLLHANLVQDAYRSIGESGDDFAAAVGAFRALGERWGLSAALVGYGEHLVVAGDAERAAEVLTEAWDIARRFIPDREQPGFLLRLANIRIRAGDVDTAEAELAQAIALRERTHRADGTREHEWWFQRETVSAEVHRARGRYAEARACYRRVLDWADDPATRHRPPQLAAMAYNGLARVALDAGRPDEATTLARDGLRRLAGAAHLDMPLVSLLTETLILIDRERDPRRAATLAGALEAIWSGRTRPNAELGRALDEIRDRLGADDYARARADGAELDLDGIYRHLQIPLVHR
ncbi:SARP family transcriptional regulator [Actinocatenispora thailandica]|uniref:SARP family transcriptional regulator n=1 Tax=Actinocatenispora thailandica TaxID=227318 RepID=A0A7R7DNJ0_9ACTN|nr:BTAD domain-containing putative transcriptional regulator [Actinocatenispora thailandica]BCJ35020.1 SARP family transcriptional regulator [Actinocatenispora thailandica]